MANYCVNSNAQPTGEHEVHNVDACNRLPAKENRIPLGDHASCHGAMTIAKAVYSPVDGCYYCCSACHSRIRPMLRFSQVQP